MSRPRSGGPGVQGGGAPRSREGGSLGAERVAGAELWMCAPGLMRVCPAPGHTRFPADTPSHGVPLERSETQRYRLADLAANVSKRSRRLVHLRFPVARVTPVLAGSASLRLGVCSRGCTRVPGGRRGDQCSPRPHPDGGLPESAGPPQPGGGGPGREPTALTRAAGAAGAAGHLGGDHFPDDAAPRGSSGNWPSRPRRPGPRGPLHRAQVPKNEREMQYLKGKQSLNHVHGPRAADRWTGFSHSRIAGACAQ